MTLMKNIYQTLMLGGLTTGLAACPNHATPHTPHVKAVGFPSDTLKCKQASDCGSSALDLACTAYPNPKACDKTFTDSNGFGRCVIKTVNQCAQNDTRGVTLADSRTGVVECDITKCDWGQPKPCGDLNQACCAGGCKNDYKCSNHPAGGAGTVCVQPPSPAPVAAGAPVP